MGSKRDEVLAKARELAEQQKQEEERIAQLAKKSKEEIYIEEWEKKKNSPEFQEQLSRVKVESNLLRTAESLKVKVDNFEGETPKSAKTKDLGIIQDAFTLYLGGYTIADIARVLGCTPSAIASIRTEYGFESKKDRLTAKILRKTEELYAREQAKKQVQVLPEMGTLIEKMLARMKEYLDNPEQYNISHETVYKQSLEWLKTYGKATGELQDSLNVELTHGQVFKKIMEMDVSNIDTTGFKAESIEEPKLIE